MSDTILVTNNLTKKYGDKLAVDSASISIRKGAIFGLIGMNGAGKTTIMKMISGMVKPTSGDYDYTGFDCKKEDAFSRIGALIEAPAIYPNMSAYDNMKMKCLAYGINSKEYIEEKLKLVGLGYTGKKKAGKFSLGMKQRLGIALALVGDPDFLLLDEPINGLDPQGIVEVREMLLKLSQEKGVTILISSHILEELSKIATDYAIIGNGRIIEQISQQELLSKCKDKIVIKSDSTSAIIPVLDRIGVTDYELVDSKTIYVYNKNEEVNRINKEIAMADILVDSIGVATSDIEEYFLETTSKGAGTANNEPKEEASK